MIFFYKSSNFENFSTVNILDIKHKNKEMIIIICIIIAIIYEFIWMVLFFIYKLNRIEFKYYDETLLIIPNFKEKTKKVIEKIRIKKLIKKKRRIYFDFKDKKDKYFNRQFPTAKEVKENLLNNKSNNFCCCFTHKKIKIHE